MRMTEKIIVTVTDQYGSFCEDLELPTNLPMVKLKDDIVQTINGYCPELNLPLYGVRVFSNRRNIILNDAETLAKSGIWNGDYLTLVFEAREH